MALNALGVVLLRSDRARPLGELHERGGVRGQVKPADDHHERPRARRHALPITLQLDIASSEARIDLEFYLARHTR